MNINLKIILAVAVFCIPIQSFGKIVVAWGDSLTQGAGGTPWPTQFSGLSGIPSINEGVGGNTSTMIAARFFENPDLMKDFAVIWAGRNNFADPTTVESDIAGMIKALNSPNYLVLGVINGNYPGYESTGGSGLADINQINAALAASYGNHFIDIRSILVNDYNPLFAEDVSDFQNDMVPASLRSDNIHLNSQGYGIVANMVYSTYTELLLAPAPGAWWLFLSGFGLLALNVWSKPQNRRNQPCILTTTAS